MDLKKNLHEFFPVCRLLLVSVTLPAVAAGGDDKDLSLDGLLNLTITVASQSGALTEQESPGIVSVITADEIRNSGARDLVDVLRMVPGFDVELDMSGALGMGIRGAWASDGKVLVLIDGIEVNDEQYLSVPLGQHIPVDNIERIEIIRGPGSAMYGGAAELGVISIITKKPDGKKFSMEANATAGKTANVMGRANGTIIAGAAFNETVSATGTVHVSDGFLSDRRGMDIYGADVDYGTNDVSKLSSVFASAGVKAGNLTANFIYDLYKVNFSYPSYSIGKYPFDFEYYLGKINYHLPLSDKVSVAPGFQAKIQSAWRCPSVFYDDGTEYIDWEDNIQSMKYTLALPFTVSLTKDLKLVAGANQDIIRGSEDPYDGTFDTNVTVPDSSMTSMLYRNTSLYAEMTLNSAYGNMTAGGRLDYHNHYGVAAVPRFAYTKTFRENLYLKLLLSGAYRAPSMMNISYNQDISPEKTNVLETEIGITPLTWLRLSANGFGMQMQKPIIYSYIPATDEDMYENGGNMTIGGFECIAKARKKGVFCDLSYSFSRIMESDSSSFSVPGISDRNLSMAAHKLTAAAGMTFSDQITLTPSVVFLGPRWGMHGAEINTVDSTYYLSAPREYPSSTLLNICVLWQVPWVKGMSVSVSSYNLLDDGFSFIEAYSSGWEAPVPGLSREAVVRVGYSF